MALGGVLGGFVFDIAASYYAAFSVGVAFNVANLVLIGTVLLRERPGVTPPPELKGAGAGRALAELTA